MSLNELLQKADAMFPRTEKAGLQTYNFTLGKFPAGWRFDVVNNWQEWMDKGLETHFGLYKRPEHAVAAFLNYVRERKIDVMGLAND